MSVGDLFDYHLRDESGPQTAQLWYSLLADNVVFDRGKNTKEQAHHKPYKLTVHFN